MLLLCWAVGGWVGEDRGGKVLDQLGLIARAHLCCAEQEGLAALCWQVVKDGVQCCCKAHVQDAVGFVQHQQLQVGGLEARSLIHMLQQAA